MSHFCSTRNINTTIERKLENTLLLHKELRLKSAWNYVSHTMWQQPLTLTVMCIGTLTGETDYAVLCGMIAQFQLFISFFFLFIIWVQWHSDGIFDQCDNSPRVPAVGGVRPHTQSDGGQCPGCTEYSNRWAFISLAMHTQTIALFTLRSYNTAAM